MAVTMDTARIDRVLAAATREVPGVVAVAADDRGVCYEGAFGRANVDTDAAMTPDAMFRIASMTKVVTSVAAAQLVERGDLDLDAPVGSILPAFDRLDVLEGFDGDTPRLRRPASRATVRQLMTHTSGLPYWIWDADASRYLDLTGVPTPTTGLRSCFQTPLRFDPGTRFQYGISTDWLGQVVEAVSGQTLDAYFTRNVFEPLGMDDTVVKMSDAQRERSVPVHARRPDGSFAVTGFDWEQDPEFWPGGHCLYTTAGDFLALQRALLARGTLGRTRILGAETVDQMLANHIGELAVTPFATAHPELSTDVDLGPDRAWGLGFLLTTREAPGYRSAGSGGWAGLFNSYFWVDPARRVTAAVHMQFLPFYDDRAVRLATDFEQALYATLG
ncbi:MAG TPA: serine hydrolase domain-containing protein [Acidimicrobiales bacterium]|nr:serine hydrolase domain-containing protein [Acidimicrobiales bacterium]